MAVEILKKVAALSALCIGTSCCIPSIYAKEVATHQDAFSQYGFLTGSKVYATTPASISLSLYQETRGSDVYLIISTNQTGLNATVDNSTIGVEREDLYRFRYKVPRAGWYKVCVSGMGYGSAEDSLYVNKSDYATSLSLSKEYKDGNCYLIIDYRDDDGIQSARVDSNNISLNEYSGKYSYRIYNTGTYTVSITDKVGHTKTESLYINTTNSKQPTLSLAKNYKMGKWYLSIKANSDSSISKVTMNGTQVTFPSGGGTEEYAVNNSCTYKVVVTDKEGLTTSDSIYIDVSQKTSSKPVVNISQNYKLKDSPGWYLIIKATDDGSIASVTVNGENVPFNSSDGTALYYVPVDGTYTIVVTDNDGNAYTSSTYAAGNAGINTNAIGNSDTSISKGVTTIFKLNSRDWTQNQTAQSKMEVAPKVINSRVYLPVRYVAYALGIDSGSILWNQDTQTVTISSGSKKIVVKVGSKIMSVNGQSMTIHDAPTTRGGRVLLPVSQICKVFSSEDVQINWDNTKKQLTIIR